MGNHGRKDYDVSGVRAEGLQLDCRHSQEHQNRGE